MGPRLDIQGPVDLTSNASVLGVGGTFDYQGFRAWSSGYEKDGIFKAPKPL